SYSALDGTLTVGMASYSLESSSIDSIGTGTLAGRWVQGSVLGRIVGGAERVLWIEKHASLPTSGNPASPLPVINFRVTSHLPSGAASMASITYSRPPGCWLHHSSLPSGMRQGSGECNVTSGRAAMRLVASSRCSRSTATTWPHTALC